MPDIPQVGLPDNYQPQDIGDLGTSNIQEGTNKVSSALDQAGQEDFDVVSYKSKTNLLDTYTSFTSSLNDARMSIYTNPTTDNITAQQKLIQSNAAAASNIDGLTTYDSSRLSKMVEVAQKGFDTEAAVRLKQNADTQALTNFNSNFQPLLQQIHQAHLNGDTLTAATLSKNLMDNATTLAQQKILPQSSFMRVNDLLGRVNARGAAVSSDPTSFSDPVNVNIMKESGLNPNTIQNPENKDSNALTQSYSNATNLSDAKSAIAQGKDISDYLFAPSTSDADYTAALHYFSGYNIGKGIVGTGVSYPNIVTQLTRLKNQAYVSPEGEGYRDSLANTIKSIKNDNFNFYTTQTSNGKNGLQALNDEVTAIKQSAVLDPAAKYQKINDAQARFANGAIAFANAHQIPMQYVKPFPDNDANLQTLNMAFSPGYGVDSAVKLLRSANNPVVPFYINSLSSATQQEAAHLASIAPDSNGSSIILSSNQNQLPDGVFAKSWTGIGSDSYSDQKVLTALYSDSKISKYLSYVSQIPNGIDRIGGVQKALINTVKSCIITHPSNTIGDCTGLISRTVVPSSSSYNTGTTSVGSYNFLTSQFKVPVSEADAKNIAQMSLMWGNSKIASLTSKDNQTKLQAQQEVNPLAVTNTPVGSLVVYNKFTGQNVLEIPVDSHLLGLGRSYAKEIKDINTIALSSVLP